MSFTLRNKAENGGGGSSTTVAVTLSGTNIQAGDLVIAGVGGANDTLSSISDGTSSLTLLGDNASGVDHLKMGYLLSSVATGLPTYTATFAGAGASQRELHVWVFSQTATASLDTERHDGSSASSGSFDTGAITTTGTDEVTVTMCYYDAAGAVTSPQTNSVAATDSLNPAGNAASWYNTQSSTFTGNGTATKAATRFMASIAAFKISGGGTAVTPTVNEAVTVTESVTMKMDLKNMSSNDAVTVIDALTMHMPIAVRMYKP